MSLVPSAASTLQRTGHWVSLAAITGDAAGAENERKRRAKRAANERDLPELWSLTEAHLTLYGDAGGHLSRHTLRAYRAGVSALLDAWSGVNLLHPTLDDAALWLRSMEAGDLSRELKPLAPATVRVRLAAARRLYAALRWAKATEADPFPKENIRPARDKTPAHEKRQPYRAAEIEELVKTDDLADRAVVLLGAHAGLRASEMCALTWRHVDLGAREITVVEGKGGKTRTVPIGDSLVQCLTQLRGSDQSEARARSDAARRAVATRFEVRHEPASETFVLPARSDAGLRKRLQRLCEERGVPFRALHSLRHSYGTRAARDSGRIELVQRLMGHSSISTTQIYVALAREELAAVTATW